MGERYASVFLCLLTFQAFARDEKIFVVSIPKCGTHMLTKCTSRILGPGTHAKWAANFLKIDRKELRLLLPTEVYTSHAPCIPSNLKALTEVKKKGLFIYRDPRDHLVSAAYWVKKQPKVWPHLQHMSISQLLLKFIGNYNTFSSLKPDLPAFKSVTTTYRVYMPWKFQPYIYTTTFERLIGPLGGGSREKQLQEIQNIADHLEVKLDTEQAETLAQSLFGGTGTFREGKVGAWKEHFNDEHKKAFKQVAGKLLVELGYEKDLLW